MRMKRKMLYVPVSDPARMPEFLNRLALELEEESHYPFIQKGTEGEIKIKFLDENWEVHMEVHYVPGDGGIYEYIFSKE